MTKNRIKNMKEFFDGFINQSTGMKKFGNYRISDDNKEFFYSEKDGHETDLIALRLNNGDIIGNASLYEHCGFQLRSPEKPIQRYMVEKNVPVFPFNVLDEVDLNINNVKIVVQGKSEDFLLPKMVWSNFREEFHIPEFRTIIYNKTGNMPKDGYKLIEKKFIREQNLYKVIYVKKNGLENRHFVGAMIISVQNKYFLFDVDRNEIKNFLFNAFLVELPKKVTNIKDAYISLKPQEVVDAEKNKLKVLRQGEWFFIPTKFNFKKNDIDGINETIIKKPTLEEYDLYGFDDDYCDNYGDSYTESRITLKDIKSSIYVKNMLFDYKIQLFKRVKDFNDALIKYYKSCKNVDKEEVEEKIDMLEYGGDLIAGDNTPNTVGYLIEKNGKTYVKGKITHGGRQHTPIYLKKWCQAIPNTAIGSFTIEGGVD